ncbi:MAG TPA: hypothetical protein DEE98_04355 [Elusimicrobia bacterium]|nr:MAG: hypothetical protein A2278_08895 [Elusimicrobia bacterium RIFOXYA12_FULL_49_49]OGS08637.1 MAG: hypothetical protein A2204_01000 [Elusimicrobia bacterium RIFOXYA1_FULL_47_7]OGS10733.1 MAG: hypothetical protein A2386_02970 [Elusimicrobia bacterium RIFOXYB1_FULL_48_9]OGS14757.1 MAG: hypothetical protein A2251_09700 [Elusimicrobia bacterium RIFOXYA2_FULL_47_53]OGS25592.1 MAG: hypothetical protein A2339_05895 [Elusimicrobia bacterium RIFOXYB12_FULL_50_12]OGS28959.1 MAG: hypothetical protein
MRKFMKDFFGRSVLAAWVLLAAASGLYAEIKAYPVPWIPEDGKVRTGNVDDGITFSGLPASGEILIYTSVGNLVRKVELASPAGGKLSLFGKDDGFAPVPSGVYVWKVKAPNILKTGKIVVVR